MKSKRKDQENAKRKTLHRESAEAAYTARKEAPEQALKASLRQKKIPVRRITALGKNKFNTLSDELMRSAFMQHLDRSPDFSELQYEAWDIKAIRSHLHKSHERLRKAKSAEEAEVYLRKSLEMWSSFTGMAALAKQRAMMPEEDQDFYREEYARAVQSAPLIERSVLELASAILSKPWLDEFGTVFGKPFLLRLNANFTLSELAYRDLYREEKELCRRTAEQAEHFSNMARHATGLRQPDILLDDLIRLRNELSEKLGFSSYRDYIMTEQRLFDYDYELLRSFREEVKRYWLPIHKYLNEKLQKELEEAKLPFRKEQLQGRIADGAEGGIRGDRAAADPKEYYARYRGDSDWELRYFKTYMPELARNEEQGPVYSPLYRLNEAPEFFFRDVAEISDSLLPRTSRGFLQLLGAKGYVLMNFKEPAEPFSVQMFPDNACPLLSGTYKNNSRLLSDFLRLTGRAYAAVLTHESQEALLPYSLIEEELKDFYGLAFELMALDDCDALFGKQRPGYAKQRLLILLRDFLKACMIDEFEDALYTQEELSMSDRLDLWQHLRENYGMKFYTRDIFWADDDLQEALFVQPYTALIRQLPAAAALSLWDIKRSNKNRARGIYERICRAGGADTFIETMKVILRPDLFSKDHVKRLAFQLAAFLEQ